MNNDDLDIIMGRVKILFKRKPRTIYKISVVNDHFDQTYNFFFCVDEKEKRSRSVPLHSIKTYELEYLEELITAIKKQTKLTIEYSGFKDVRWPKTNLLIQKR